MAGQESDTESFDVVVIGAGIIGSSAAYHCMKADGGKRVLLLEQYALPHARGGSHGGHRMFVIAGSKGHHRTMIEESYSLWKTLEAETKTEILREDGVLVVGPSAKLEGFAAKFQNDHAANLSEEPFERLSEGERVQRFPLFTSKFASIFYPKAGFIKANKALKAFQSEFLRRGGVLRDEEKMQEIIPGAMVTIKTNQGVYRAKSLILALGAWMPKVLQQLGLTFQYKIWRVDHIFWKEKVAGTYWDFPIFEHLTSEGGGAYGCPSREYPGLMKVCIQSPTPITDPDERDSVPDTSREIEKTRDYVREHFPGLDADNGPAITEPCMVVITNDKDFILDTHPNHSNIAFQFATGPGGFAFAPILGKILSQLAVGQTISSHDLQPMSIKRLLT